ncbi:E3 ubiquitin-protein ligase RNF182-like [Protopterus annectens]|uniref:E3 ubiquitin-protein ligase RNF182-like n=1 Tax=Protopterus annectens TaxID=7888 RepID=UPI001CF98177|nr:E3 ubiquitin-protein ligase RNF182-like [Protopterus annectens]XP_043946166.1 E3 ubiquitin-protein ligase RNF182-like [Protopterus annectens]
MKEFDHIKSLGTKMSQKDRESESCQPLVVSSEELECKICYNRYDTRTRKPKVLSCLHRVCVKCLKKIVDIDGSSPSVISCPFCRHETHVPDDEIHLLQDDIKIIAILSYHDKFKKHGSCMPSEVVLTPNGLQPLSEQSHSSSDCLIITITELPNEAPQPESVSMLNLMRFYRPSSLDSLPCHCPVQKCRSCTSRTFPRCIIGALCLIYFSSLPLGIYLLMISHLALGIVMVSLVPSTLILCVFCGFCQCLCHEAMECLST